MRQAEPSPDQAAPGEDCLYFLRRRIRGDVKVLGILPEQQVTNAPTDDVGFKARFLQALDDLRRVRTQLSGVDSVVGRRYDVELGNETFLKIGLRTARTRFESIGTP